MAEDWKRLAIRLLLDLREETGTRAWAYRTDLTSAVEPTALAVLALVAVNDESPRLDVSDSAEARSAGDWLASLQRADGSLGISATCAEPGWATPYAVLSWMALGGYHAERERAAGWLLRQRSVTLAKETGPVRVTGHDPSVIGWPWAGGTHAWVEPTALAILALRREGLGGHIRVQEGLRLLCDRAIVTGGWNCGNKATYGRVLRPTPAATGLALLALAHTTPSRDVVENAIGYLLHTLPGTRAAASLGWGVLGLRAWGKLPDTAPGWLASSFENLTGRVDAAPKIAMLLLAAGKNTLELFDAK